LTKKGSKKVKTEVVEEEEVALGAEDREDGGVKAEVNAETDAEADADAQVDESEV
jgi:hypothetical protein